MNLRVALVALLLSLAADTACAEFGHSQLAWDDCGDAGAPTRTFACNTNAGSEVIVFSFRPSNSVDAVFQVEVSLAVGYESLAPVPDWWSFVPTTGCRATSMRASADFTSASGACADPWFGLGFVNAQVTPISYFGDGVLRRQLIRLTATIPNAAAVPLDPAIEYYGVRLIINHQKTAGAGSCAGCSEGMCIAIANASSLANPSNPVRSELWNYGRRSITWNSGERCDRLVPVRNRTWGALKSIHR